MASASASLRIGVCDESTPEHEQVRPSGALVGEAYETMAAAKEGCAAVQRAADGATVVEADS